MTENTSSFNVFPVFFRGKTGGFGGCVGWKSVRRLPIGADRARAQGSGGQHLPAETGDRNGGEGWQGIFLRRSGTTQNNTKTPLLMERGLCYLNSDEF